MQVQPSATIGRNSYPALAGKPEISERVINLRLARGVMRLDEHNSFEKKCCRCDEFWPLDSEFWHSSSRSSDGLSSHCKACEYDRKKGLELRPFTYFE